MDRRRGLNRFSEEACRDLFVELGIEIARERKFRLGISEVQSRVLEAFGEDNYPRAMLVLDTLLQEHTSGLGEEGDLWSSWRFEYKLAKETQSVSARNLVAPRIPPRTSSIAALDHVHGAMRPTTTLTPQGKLAEDYASDEQTLAEMEFGAFDHIEISKLEDARVINVRTTRPQFLPRLQSSMSLTPQIGHASARVLTTKLSQLLGRGASQSYHRHSVQLASPGSPGSPIPPQLPPLFLDGACDPVDVSPAYDRNRAPRAAMAYLDGPAEDERNEPLVHYYSRNARDGLIPMHISEDEDQQQPIHGLVGMSSHYQEMNHPGVAELPADSGTTYEQDKHQTYTSGSSGSHSSKYSQFSASSRSHLAQIAREEAANSPSIAYSPRMARSSPNQAQSEWPAAPKTPSGEDHESQKKYLDQIKEIAYSHARQYSVNRITTMSDMMNKQSGLCQDINDLLPSLATRLPAPRYESSVHSNPPPVTSVVRHRPAPIQIPVRGRLRADSTVSIRGSSPKKPMQTISEQISQETLRKKPAWFSESSPIEQGVTFIDTIPSSRISSRMSDETVVRPMKRPGSPLKKLFGERGFFGKSSSMKEMHEKPSSLQRLGEKLREKVGDLNLDAAKGRLAAITTQAGPSSPRPAWQLVPITLDSPTQARIYGELDCMLVVTANRFILQQVTQNRISPESVERTALKWKNKGRPQVVEFQFDQKTQIDIILLNIRFIRFCGKLALIDKHCEAVLRAWRSVAGQMAVRCFCYPDSVTKKLFNDIKPILTLLGAPETTMAAFEKMAEHTVKKMDVEQQKRRDWVESITQGRERVFETPPTPRTPMLGKSRSEVGSGSQGGSTPRETHFVWPGSDEERMHRQKVLEISPFLKFQDGAT